MMDKVVFIVIKPEWFRKIKFITDLFQCLIYFSSSIQITILYRLQCLLTYDFHEKSCPTYET